MERRHYRPTYHASIPSGWCNDPNGMIYYNGKSHLYFQHYPYAAHWGTMHWGHFTTDDFIKWELQPVAIRPDQDYEVICGCCSGNAVEKDGRLYIMYTAAQPDRQRQCLAWSEDGGITFTKEPSNPILTAEMLSEQVSTRDFRDPKIIVRDGWYYCLAGTRIIDPALPQPSPRAYASNMSGANTADLVHHARLMINPSDPNGDVLGGMIDLGWGNLILFRSRDLYHWEFLGRCLYRQPGFSEHYYTLNGVYECPDIFTSNGKDVIISSPQNLPQMGNSYQNQHSVVYIPGKMNWETGRFTMDSINELDAGFDVYAPQCMTMPDGRIIMIAWKEMWDRTMPMTEDGWGGTYTLPREVEFKNGRLYQNPVREIKNYRQNKVEAGAMTLKDGSLQVKGVEGDIIELDVTFRPLDCRTLGVRFFKGAEHETVLTFNAEDSTVVFDRTNSGVPIYGVEVNTNTRTCDIDETDRIRFHIFLDQCSAEVFINDGRFAMTGNVFPDAEDTGVEFFCTGGSCEIESIVKYDIIVE